MGELMDLLKSDVQDFVAMRNAPDSTYALLGRGLDEVANREEAAEAGMDYADMMKVHEIATKHLDIFGHPEDESDSANAMRALFGLEEETERSMLGGKGFKGMLGSETAYLSRPSEGRGQPQEAAHALFPHAECLQRIARSTSTSLVTPRTSPTRQTRCARCSAPSSPSPRAR